MLEMYMYSDKYKMHYLQKMAESIIKKEKRVCTHE